MDNSADLTPGVLLHSSAHKTYQRQRRVAPTRFNNADRGACGVLSVSCFFFKNQNLRSDSGPDPVDDEDPLVAVDRVHPVRQSAPGADARGAHGDQVANIGLPVR